MDGYYGKGSSSYSIFLRIFKDFNIVQGCKGKVQVVRSVKTSGAVGVGGSPAVSGPLDAGVSHEVVLGINDRGLAPDQDQGEAVVQHPHFIRRE